MRDVRPAGLRTIAIGGCIVALLVAWSWQTWEHRGGYGQDAAIYTMMGAHFAAGDSSMLWTAYGAPGLPLLIGVFVRLGATPQLAYHVVAFLGYAALTLASMCFFAAVARLSRVPDRLVTPIGIGGGMLFALAPDVVAFGTQPMTDQFTLAALLAGIVLTTRVASTAAAASLGVSLAIAYLFRYASFAPALIVIAGAAMSLCLERRRIGLRRAATHGLLLIGPLVISACIVALHLSGAENGFSYGSNTQAAASVAVAAIHTRAPTSDVHRVLNDDGTFGYYHADPAAPDAWNVTRWLGQTTFTDRGKDSPRVHDQLAHPARALRQAGGAFAAASRPHGVVAGLVGAILFALLLLVSARELPVMLWITAAIATMTMVGGMLLYFGETRYLWFPIMAALSSLAPCAWRAWERWRAGGAQRRIAFTVFGFAMLGLASWTADSLVGTLHPGLLRSLLTQHASSTARVSYGINDLLRTQIGPREHSPNDAPTVASRVAGVAVAADARWLPLAIPIVSAEEWDAASPSERAHWLDRVLSYLSRGHARFVVLVRADYDLNPSVRPLFDALLPDGVVLVGDVSDGHEGTLARVLRLERG